MTRWFGDVPWEVGVAGVALVTAAEAVELAADREYDDFDDGGPENERDSPDWGASAVLWLARCQLDELRSLLSDEEAGRLVQAAASGDDRGHDSDDAQVLREALLLRAALAGGSNLIHHGFNVAGDITMTHGPELPPSPALGLDGSPGGEIEDSPVAVLRAAVEATLAAGRWSARRASGGNG